MEDEDYRTRIVFRKFRGVEPCAIIPAYQAASSVGAVVARVLDHVRHAVVIDDGSTDGTAAAARASGATVLSHPRNRGKGASLLTGLAYAASLGHELAVSLDADGQHDPADLPRLLAPADPRALVLGVRDLVAAGAPRANVFSNGVSNFFLSRFAGRPLRDTQCGFRRYPVREVLALAPAATGYAFEAEVLLLALQVGLPIVEVPIAVRYPEERRTHFRIYRDVPRIIARVVVTELRGARRRRRPGARAC